MKDNFREFVEKLVVTFAYGYTFYTDRVKEYALAYLHLLPDNVTHLVTSSSSGCAIATAMMALADRKLQVLYVAKEGEGTHRSDKVSRNVDALKPESIIYFVDDLIGNGTTFYRCVKALGYTDKIKGMIVIKINSESLLDELEYRGLEIITLNDQC